MKSVSVSCPDDRVALARRGALTSEEWQDFATHLTECVDCRLAWRLGSDFEHSAAARPGDERIIARGVKAALATSARPHTKLIRFAIAAAVTLVAAGAASAAIALHVRHRAAVARSEPPAAKTRPPKTHGGARRALAPIAAESAAPPLPESTAPPAEQGPVATAPEPVASAPPPPLVARVVPRPPRPRAAAAPDPDPFDGAGGAAAPALAPPPQREDAVGLFAQALRERQEWRNQTAIASFRRLQREFPASQEATVSLVSLGDLLLGSGLRAEALLAFESYLQRAPNGALAPEAWIGKARALTALGHASEARAAWSEIARRFPSSAYGQRGRAGPP